MKIKRTLITAETKLSPRIEKGVDADVVEDYAACYEQLPPIVVFKLPDQSNYLLADGWHRFRAAERLGLEEVEADVKYGTLVQAKEYALLANLQHGQPLTRKEKRYVIEEFLKLHPERTNTWIARNLGTTHQTVSNRRLDLEETGQLQILQVLISETGEMHPRNIVQSEQEPLQEGKQEQQKDKPKSEVRPEPESPAFPILGKYKLNDIHQEDCVIGLMNLPESCLDLVFADPRYNLGKGYGDGSDDSLPQEAYFKWCMQWFLGVFRVLKPGGAFYVMHYPEVAARWKQQLDGLFTFQRWITWVYPQNVGHSNGNWTRAQRAILYYVKGDSPAYFEGLADPQPYKNPDDTRIKHRGQKGVVPYDWWEYNLVKNVSKGKTSWPNQLPVDLVWRIIATSCPEDGIVCDPCIGSGTTAEAAIKAGRSWIGFDIESRACEITKKRVEKFVSD